MVTLAVCSVQHRLRNEEEKRQAAYLMVDHDEPLENNLAISSDLSLGIVMPSFMIEQQQFSRTGQESRQPEISPANAD